MACINFKVKCVEHVSTGRNFTIGKVYEICDGVLSDDEGFEYSAWALPENGDGDFKALKKWFAEFQIFELVEEKKMLTKNDLKTGMFGVLNTGDKFVIVNDKIVYQDGGYNNISSIITDNYFNYIQKLYEGVSSFRMLDRNLKGETVYGTLVYDYDKHKTLYNGKVVCVKNTEGNANLYTVGKIYQFVDGSFTADDGDQVKNWHHAFESFEEFNEWSSSEWIEIKE